MRSKLRQLLPTQGDPTRRRLPLLQRTPNTGSTWRSFSSSNSSCVMVPSSLTVRSIFMVSLYGDFLFFVSFSVSESASLS
ncbi:hypothetical protein D3C85_1846810 [compost metagenome]